MGHNRILHLDWEIQTNPCVHQQNHQCGDNIPGATANQTVFMHGYSISVCAQPMLCALGIKPVATSGTQAPYSPTSPFGLMPAVMRALGFSETNGRKRDSSKLGRFLSKGQVPLEDEVEINTLKIDIPYNSVDEQADASVQKFPGQSEIFNPSALINDFILESYPDATVALTHDDHLWTGIADKVHNSVDATELVRYAIINNLVLISKGSGPHNACIAKRRWSGE
ncbi:uncharacterized protein EV420DRAFT_1487034 [Desarmillaria tabescens]|uniref:Uncharacterized protein n=1 Tax=Armillaria tabescens TaxID=1929756 RepID=A0AA39ML93_ARMTA|nr:uncharacterized protein EV420DRAFT_1487034 [Desarmillaria tabescens]KAK0437585.1 hypothetical protein EV420DRAFT_1487034 [Desarmillaria tabescens]